MTIPGGLLAPGEHGDYGQPSAIQSLLQSMAQPPMPPPGMTPQGGPPMPPPQAAPLPPQAPAQKPHMMSRIMDFLGSLGGDAVDAGKGVVNSIGNPGAAPGYEGLLTPQQMAQANPGRIHNILSALGGGNPHAEYVGNLNNILQMHQIAGGVAEQQRIRALRQNIEARFPLKANPTDAEIRNNLAQRYDAYIGGGDGEMAKEIGASLRGIMTAPKEDNSPGIVVTPGGAYVDRKTGQPMYQAPLMDKAADYTQYVDQKGNIHVLKKDESPPAGWKTVPLTQTQITVAAAADRAATGREDKAVKDFTTQIKPLTARAQAIDQAIMTVDKAKNSPDPNERKALYSSALINFIQAADQKAQIRQQILQYFRENINASAEGRWNLLKDRVLKGQLPEQTMAGMLTHLQNLKGLTQSEIETQRKGLVSRRPELDDALPKTSEFFAPDQAGQTGSTVDPSALYNKYKLAPRKP